MPDPSPRQHWIVRYARRVAIASLVLLGGYIAIALERVLDHHSLPDTRVHVILVTVPAVTGLVSLILFVYSSLSRKQDRIAQLIIEEGKHRVQALSRLNQTIVDELQNRADLNTDRLVALERVVSERQKRVDSRLAVIESAVDQHICKGYVDGYGDAAAGRPPSDVRPRLTRINGYKS